MKCRMSKDLVCGIIYHLPVVQPFQPSFATFSAHLGRIACKLVADLVVCLQRVRCQKLVEWVSGNVHRAEIVCYSSIARLFMSSRAHSGP